jgi:hypothetical protein
MTAVPSALAELIEAIADRAAELALDKLTAQAEAEPARPRRLPAEPLTRDLGGEAAALLASRPGLTLPEIARALRKRDETIRQTLETSARVTSRSQLPGRSPKAIGWFLTPDSSPTDPAPRTSPLEPASTGTFT